MAASLTLASFLGCFLWWFWALPPLALTGFVEYSKVWILGHAVQPTDFYFWGSSDSYRLEGSEVSLSTAFCSIPVEAWSCLSSSIYPVAGRPPLRSSLDLFQLGIYLQHVLCGATFFPTIDAVCSPQSFWICVMTCNFFLLPHWEPFMKLYDPVPPTHPPKNSMTQFLIPAS